MVLKVLWFVPPAIALLGGGPSSGGAISAARTSGSEEQFEALMSGACDFAVTAMDNVIGWNARPGAGDFRIFAQVETTTPLHLIARPDVDSIAHLKGRRLLVDSAENGFVVALLMLLRDAGVGREDVTLVPAGGVSERSDAVVSGAGDATLLGPPFDAGALARGMVRLGQVNIAYPGFPGQGIVARTSRVAKMKDQARSWFAALEAGRALARAEPARAAEAIEASGMPAPIAKAMVAAAPESLRPDHAGVSMLGEHRRLLGLPGAGLAYSDLVDDALLEPFGEPRQHRSS